jgi:DNA polymerase III alpha subunit
MIPLFKTHASIGRSILRIEDVKRIADENEFDEVYLVEDTMVGFPEAFRTFGEKLRFGYRFSIYNDDESDESESKMIVFADGDQGYKDLCSLYTRSFGEKLKTPWDEYRNLKFAVPFYDSFLHKNLVGFTNCMPNLPKDIYFLAEDNGLPFDGILYSKVKDFAEKNAYSLTKVKSIYYENKEDVEAFQTYKCICNRQPGRQASLSNPRLDHFGSDRFCVEAWKEDQ